MSISLDSKDIEEAFNGKMGIKQIFIGDEIVYERTGSYVYVELKNSEGNN